MTDETLYAATEFQTDLGYLRALARSCFTGHHHHLMSADELQQFLLTLGDGEFGRIGDGRHGTASFLDA